ncbi:MAG TPA: Wzz/FepE/Etk N-terminal domain-containing protein, partial [Patescibacteria group bacterium]|nr:Wzz/FepE/Etk N-terminal domain-containing protein [Patescibacteria group bacterium]
MNNRLFSVQDVIKPLVSSWGMLVLGTMLFALLVVGITLIQPLKYSSTVRLLVIQKSDSVVDPYTSSRGAEKIAQLITQIVHSDSFMEKVVSSGFQVRDDYGSDL